ncbi:MAG: hypothetical protein KAS23_05515 [Anaerohalosphaera sp.]|nr:hypothetical protein [Anaerohalosphaera sp.]
MDKNIENEINLTLQCFGESSDINVAPSFIDNLTGRLDGIHPRRGPGYTNRSFYPVMIALMVVLNFTAFFVSYKGNLKTASASSSSTNVLAAEYSIGQNSLASF